MVLYQGGLFGGTLATLIYNDDVRSKSLFFWGVFIGVFFFSGAMFSIMLYLQLRAEGKNSHAAELAERKAARLAREAAEAEARAAKKAAIEAAKAAAEQEKADKAAQKEADQQARAQSRTSGRETATDRFVKNMASTAGRQIGNIISRGILGGMKWK